MCRAWMRPICRRETPPSGRHPGPGSSARSRLRPSCCRSQALGPLYKLSYGKWYFDEAYLWFVDNVVLAFAWVESQFDMIVIDGLVNGVSFATVAGGEGLKYAETGR